jgi:hypothetical protein
MSDEPRDTQKPGHTSTAGQPDQDAPRAAMPAPPQIPAAERVRLAAQRRGESDYILNYWTALGWTILTLGIYGFYVFYQLVRRMRDHNVRRLELWMRRPPLRGSRRDGGAFSRRWPRPSSGLRVT